MRERLKILRNRLEQEKGKAASIRSTIETVDKDIRIHERSIRDNERAREIVREVGLKTQQQLQYHISDITSLALEDIFDDPYALEVEFVQRRNKTECDLHFVRNGSKIDPESATGGGAVDVAAFALRIASWSMQSPRTRNVMILDEPFKFLDSETDRVERASQMIKELSDRLDLQFIIITHEQTLAQYADRTFHISIHDGISKVMAR